MKRVLVFDGEKGPKRFELLRTALLSGGDGKGERTREVIRKEARLLTALDSISSSTNNDALPDERKLNDDSGPVTVTQEDFDLLSQYADRTPWLPRAAREAVDLQDWLSSAEKLD